MRLSAFLDAFFGALRSKGIAFCVLRNYERLPLLNTAGDIDLLVEPVEVFAAVEALLAVPGVSLTSIVQRPYVVSTHIRGLMDGCLQIDFLTGLSWRGIKYLEVGSVLERAQRHPHCDWIPIPEAVDEGIISFASSFLIGGFIKHRYSDTFTSVFRDEPSIVEERLSSAIAPRVLRPLIERVANGQYESALALVGPCRSSLLGRAMYRNPFSVMSAMVRHVGSEVLVHVASSNLCTVVVFGPDGAGKSTVIDAVADRLHSCAKIMEKRHLRPVLPGVRTSSRGTGPVMDPHARPAKPKVASTLQLLVWFAAYWLDRLFRRKRNSTLRIYDRYYHDVLVDPRRYRYGGSLWFARLVSRLVPQPDLVVILDAPPEVLRSRKQEVAEEETIRQRAAYLEMSHRFPNTLVVDASLPLDGVVDRVEQGIVELMVRRTTGVLRKRSRP